jgi:ubiquinone/menaquinone biosynthesis C-methylase UbiE
MAKPLEERKQREIEFHNDRERDRLQMGPEEFLQKYSNKKFYRVARATRDTINAWIDRHGSQGLALDYCCGLGVTTLEFTSRGARTIGIDISDRELKTAFATATERGHAGMARFVGMDAEKLAFKDATFDAVICNGVLHHLDLERAYSEIARVLKPNGRVLCIEALGHNPAIRLYRRLTPHLRTAWESEHILRVGDVYRARKYFCKVTARYLHLATIGAVPLRNTALFEPVLWILEMVDRAILRVPGVRRLAWQIVFELREPRRGV